MKCVHKLRFILNWSHDFFPIHKEGNRPCFILRQNTIVTFTSCLNLLHPPKLVPLFYSAIKQK